MEGSTYTRQWRSTLKEILYNAVIDCDIPVLRTLFRASSSSPKLRILLDAPEFDSYTALQRACIYGNAELVSLLLDQGVDIEARGKDNWTALHATVWHRNNDLKILKILLNSFANVLARDDHGCLPIDLARDMESRHILVQQMRRRGATDLADLYSKIELRNMEYSRCESVQNISAEFPIENHKISRDSQICDYIEVDTDEQWDSDEALSDDGSSSKNEKQSAMRNWKSNLAVWGSCTPPRNASIKRNSQVSESSISLISEMSAVKCRDSGVYCDGEDDMDALAASFQEGKSCLSRWEPYYDLSSVSP